MGQLTGRRFGEAMGSADVIRRVLPFRVSIFLGGRSLGGRSGAESVWIAISIGDGFVEDRKG